MTPPPPAATAAPRAAGLRRPGARIPRRVSRPVRRVARGRRGAAALPRGLAIPRISPRSLAASVAWHVRSVIGGRGLIAVLAGMLLGLVFLQVSLLKLGTQIGQNVERAHELERDNAALRTVVSRLDAGQRIQDAAGRLGMVMPGAGSVCYLDARRGGPCRGGDPTAADAADALPAQSAGVATATTPPPVTTTATGQAEQAVTAPAQAPPGQAQPAQPQAPQPAAPQAQTAPAQQPAAAPQQTAPATTQAQPTGGIAAGAAQ